LPSTLPPKAFHASTSIAAVWSLPIPGSVSLPRKTDKD
jgi:hypothetical protein